MSTFDLSFVRRFILFQSVLSLLEVSINLPSLFSESNDDVVTPYNTQLRLVQGGTGFSSSGFVEIYLCGSWGSVCNMKINDASTACRQLGYTDAYSAGGSSL